MKITVSVPLQIVDGKNPLTELLEIIIFVSWYFLFVWLILLLLPLVTQSCFLCGSLCACASLKIGLSRIFLFFNLCLQGVVKVLSKSVAKCVFKKGQKDRLQNHK